MLDNMCSCYQNNKYHSNLAKNSKCNDNKNKVSVVNCILTNIIVVNPGSYIPFNTKRIYLTDDIIQDDNNTDFKFYRTGLYKVNLVANAKLNMGEVSNNISIAIQIDGTIIPGTIVNKSCGQNEIINLVNQVVFYLEDGKNATLNIVNVKENETTIVCDNANIIIEKLK